ncbi:MAG: retroviral-like aspartic protease family protein [Odoribacteraceae bacterium]|jgi:hypothetical protein|nr:retroviral-like aspartic protease family protein [Odoribacteraceae bacterium]
MIEIRVPVEFVQLDESSYHPLVTVAVGRIEGDFILDTGASITVIEKFTPFSFKRLGDTRGISSGGIGGDIGDVELVRLETMTIGGHTFRDEHVALVDLQYVNTLYRDRLKRRVSGLIGSDFLVKYRALVDYENRVLVLKVSAA